MPRYRLILLPVNGADALSSVAMHAAFVAHAIGAAVAVLGVIDTGSGFQFGAEGAARYARLRAETHHMIETAGAIVREAGVARVEHLIMDGVPRDAILDVADEQGADLIVIGAAEGEMVGHLIRDARYPVLVVPQEREAY